LRFFSGWRSLCFCLNGNASLKSLNGPRGQREGEREPASSFAVPIWHDLRYAARSLRRSGWFTAVAATIIAVGIGSSVAMFSVVNQLILHPLPFTDSEQLVLVASRSPRMGVGIFVDAAMVDDWGHRAKSFDALSIIAPRTGILRDADRSIYAQGADISASLLARLGVSAEVGRLFSDADEMSGAPRVIVLTDRSWRRDFGTRHDVIGRTVSLSDTTYTIVGVASERLGAIRTYAPDDYWLPLTSAEQRRLVADDRYVQAIGHIKAGISKTRAETELKLLAQQWENAHGTPQSSYTPAPALVLPSDMLGANLVVGLWALLGTTILVMLLGCANVANLQLVRAAKRRGEIAVLSALGASRGRLLRQLSAEGAIVAIIGGSAGLGIADLILRGLVAFHPQALPQLEAVQFDLRAVAFGVAVAAMTSILCGLVPAWYATSRRLADATRTVWGGGRSTARTRVPSAVVVLEIALSVVLLVDAGLLVRSFARMNSTDPGFRPNGLVELTVQLPQSEYPDSASRTQFWSELLSRARGMPGVADAVPATASMAFDIAGLMGADVQLENGTTNSVGSPIMLSVRSVPSGYFRTLGIPIRRGSTFSRYEERAATGIAVVGHSLAARLWPNADPIGKRFRLLPSEPWLRVIGVVSDIGLVGPGTDNMSMQMYLPSAEVRLDHAQVLFVRARAGTIDESLVASLRALVHSIAPRVPVLSAQSASTYLNDKLAGPRFSTSIMLAFAVVTFVLASFGLYSVIAYNVSRQTHDIGVRIALGAQPYDIARTVVQWSVRLAVIGVVVGLLIAFASVGAIRALLYGVSTADPTIYIIVPFGLMLVTLAASYAPMRRALRADPVRVLRAE